MFSSVGWGEILVLIIVGIIVVGPERLPRIITDVKAMIHAARGAITSAKEELGDDFKEDFEDFRKPLSQINDMRRMGARGLVSKALLDDDPEFFRDIEASARGVSSAVTGQGGSASASTRSTGASSQAPAASVESAESSAPAGATESSEAGDTTATGQKNTDGGADWGSMDEGDVL